MRFLQNEIPLVNGMDNTFMIRLLDPILDKINRFGDKYPLSYLTWEKL